MNLQEVKAAERLLNEFELETDYEFFDHVQAKDFVKGGKGLIARVLVVDELVGFDDLELLEACLMFRLKYGETHPAVFQRSVL